MANDDPTYLGIIKMLLGAEQTIDVTLEDRDGGSLSHATATITFYNTAGSVVSGPSDCTMSGDTERVASYLVTTGAGKILTSAGVYRAVIQPAAGSEKPKYQVNIIVKSAPF